MPIDLAEFEFDTRSDYLLSACSVLGYATLAGSEADYCMDS